MCLQLNTMLSLRDYNVRAISFLLDSFFSLLLLDLLAMKCKYSSAFAAGQWGYHLLSEIPSKSTQWTISFSWRSFIFEIRAQSPGILYSLICIRIDMVWSRHYTSVFFFSFRFYLLILLYCLFMAALRCTLLFFCWKQYSLSKYYILQNNTLRYSTVEY